MKNNGLIQVISNNKEYITIKTLPWRCSAYRGCNQEIACGEYGVVTFHKDFSDRIEMYCEKCFDKENKHGIMKVYFEESLKKIERHRRPFEYE